MTYRTASDLQWTCFDDSDHWIVFNPASAAVHLLTPAARRLWTLISERAPASSAAVIAALVEEVGASSPSRADLTQAAEDTLAFMDRAGLVLPV